MREHKLKVFVCLGLPLPKVGTKANTWKEISKLASDKVRKVRWEKDKPTTESIKAF